MMRTSSKLGRSPRFRQSIAELEIRAGERERGLDRLRLMRIEKIKNRRQQPILGCACFFRMVLSWPGSHRLHYAGGNHRSFPIDASTAQE
jgi:hypothetical protein